MQLSGVWEEKGTLAKVLYLIGSISLPIFTFGVYSNNTELGVCFVINNVSICHYLNSFYVYEFTPEV